MKAAVLYGDYDLRYEEFAEPEVKPGFVKVKVGACGVCGSDIPRITAGKAHYYPIVLGHEFAGTVAEVGEGVTSLKPGDHIAAAPLVPCLECRDCSNGHYSQCKNYTFIGSRIPGGYGEYVVMPERNAVKIDDRIPFEQGALFEPSTVALHGVRCADYKGGGIVAVLGGGTIGLFTMQWAKILGAKKVVVFGLDKKDLEIATRLGADAVISTLDEDFMEQAMAETEGVGYDYVFETAGATATMKMAFDLAANQAHVCMIGTPSQDLTFTPRQWEQLNRKEFKLTGSWMSGNAPYPGDEWTLTSHCFANGQLKYDEGIFYKKIPLSKPEELTETLKDRSKIKGRILLVHE